MRNVVLKERRKNHYKIREPFQMHAFLFFSFFFWNCVISRLYFQIICFVCIIYFEIKIFLSFFLFSKSHYSGMLCVMRVSPTLPRLRVDFIFSLLSKYATGIRYTLDTSLHQKRQLEATVEDDDDTNQSVSSIEDDFVTAFEHLEEEETSKPYNDGLSFTWLFLEIGN